MDICMEKKEIYSEHDNHSKIKIDDSEMSDNSTEISLLNFDDMVLSKIMKHLRIVDLANLSETCVRLEYLSKQYFEKHHSHLSWANNHSVGGNTLEPSEAEKVFKHFGKYVKSVKLSYWVDFEFAEILDILARRCTQLDTLIMKTIRMNHPILFCDPLLSSLFSRIKRFVINGCFWTGWCPLNIFFGVNSTLEELTVTNCCAYNALNYRLQLAGFRALKLLRLSDCRNVLAEGEIQGCFENNNITSLCLTNIGEFNLFQRNLIDVLFRTIDTLCLDYYSEIDLIELSRLKSLKIFRLRCHVFSDVDELLSKLSYDNNVIEELVILKPLISKSTIKALTNFKKLTMLKLECSLNSVPQHFFTTLPMILPQLEHLFYTFSTIGDDNIIHMFKLMPNLKCLNLFGCNSLSTDTYLKMVEILNNDWQRPKLKFTPPTFETLNSLNSIENFKNVLILLSS